MSDTPTAVIPLPPRMRLTLEHAAEGLTVPQTAEAMHCSTSTVDTQLKLARGRLQARNTTHAVAVAIRRGYLL